MSFIEPLRLLCCCQVSAKAVSHNSLLNLQLFQLFHCDSKHEFRLRPLACRRKLFSALPHFMLYEIEKTSIIDRINTDEIWKELSKVKGGVGRCILRTKEAKNSAVKLLRCRASIGDCN